MTSLFLQNLQEHNALLAGLHTLEDAVQQAGRLAGQTLVHGGKVLFCGNGGSAADSQHLAAELTGRFIHDRRPLAAIALSGSLVASEKPEFPPQPASRMAMRPAAAAGPPMAVLIGNGNPFAKLMEDAKLPEATAKLLREKFVCVAVDVTTPAGAKLASQLRSDQYITFGTTTWSPGDSARKQAVAALMPEEKISAFAPPSSAASVVSAWSKVGLSARA